MFCVALAVLSFRKQLSLLPTLGLLINLYLMTRAGHQQLDAVFRVAADWAGRVFRLRV